MLYKLNDDCLMHIFRLLDTREQLMLTRTCMRFREIVVDDIWRSEFREHCTNSAETNALKPKEYEEFFAMIALHLEKLTIVDPESWALTRTGRFFRPEIKFFFTFDFPHLLELNVKDVDVYGSKSVAEKCPNLRVLRLSSVIATLDYIEDLQQLRQLYVPNARLRSDDLEAIMREVPLTHLDVTGSIYCYLGHLLGKLTGTVLHELYLSERMIHKNFAVNFHKLSNLKVLQVNRVREKKNSQWPHLLQIIGANTKGLHIENTDRDTYAVHMIVTNLSLMSKLQKFYYAPTSCIPKESKFLKLTTLKELHVVHEKNLLATLPLVSNCAGLEHIFLERRRPMRLDIFEWADKLIQLLQSQTTPRPVLNVHITEYAPENQVKNMLNELEIIYPQQNKVKWVLESKSTSFVPISTKSKFVRFEFE